MIRAAAAQEAAAIAAAVVGQPLLSRYGTSGEGLAKSLGEAMARGERVVVAEEGGQVVGMAWFLVGGTLGLGGYLRLIALHPGQEGRGVGGELLAEVERAVAQASRHLFLLASDFNDGARRFYAARGYREVGVMEGLVKDGIGEVMYWKRLR
jgi:ribosomal protein S18 acetylase RimI-like enzyme